eukprot:6354173-Prymnesium_polylepis.2
MVMRRDARCARCDVRARPAAHPGAFGCPRGSSRGLALVRARARAGDAADREGPQQEGNLEGPTHPDHGGVSRQ